MQNTIPINKNIPPTDNKMFIKLEERLFPVPEKISIIMLYSVWNLVACPIQNKSSSLQFILIKFI